MRYLSVCSGIEAATVAWHPLGWEPVGFSEIEKFPSAVLQHHYPDVPNYGDMTDHEQWPTTDIDVLVGGTPCQSFSVAGLRKGMACPRGNLALVYLAIADQYRPDWLVWENVPGVLSSNYGRDFGAIIGAMVELGYSPCWRVLDAIHFGCALPRKRVFILAHRGNWRTSAKALFQPNCFAGDHPSKSPEASVGSMPILTARGAMANDDGTPCVLEEYGPRRTTPLEWERALGFPDDYTKIPTVREQSSNKTPLEHQESLRDNARRIRRDVGEAGEPMCSVRRDNGTPSDRPLPHIREGEGDTVPPVQYQATSDRGRGLDNASLGVPVSRLTPDGPRYKALGNSMAVPVMHWIGRRIDQLVKQQKGVTQ